MSKSAGPAAPADRDLQQLVLGLFIASGAAGLIYQVVWARDLVLLFDNTSQAISTIVTAFLAGLGGGALVGAGLASRSRNPLRLYGFIELGAAVLAGGLPAPPPPRPRAPASPPPRPPPPPPTRWACSASALLSPR